MGIFLSIRKVLVLIILICILRDVQSTKDDNKRDGKQHNLCGKLKTPGYTVPSGDIILQYGDALNLTCNLYEDSLKEYGLDASSRLFFTRNNNRIPQEMTEIINSTSIRLYIKDIPKTDNDNFFCMYEGLSSTNGSNPTYVCMNVIVVGVPPQEVTDFSCIGRNYENLTCSWSMPNNYVKTEYKLVYTMKKRPARPKRGGRIKRILVIDGDSVETSIMPNMKKHTSKKPKTEYYCTTQIMDNGKLGCFWNVSSSPPYRQVYDLFLFSLHMTNSFGNRTQNYSFEHFKHVLPNPPVNLVATATSTSSVRLTYEVPSEIAPSVFSPGLHHRIMYQCIFYKQWLLGGLIENASKNSTIEYEVTGIKYAHCLCSFRVSIRSAVADKNDESMWSKNATAMARTKSKIPDCPPETTLGSFEIIVQSNFLRDIYVYWKQIGEDKKNGQNFKYVLELENVKKVEVDESTSTYAFKNLSHANYTIHIWSKNDEGTSLQRSTISIPAQRLPKPTNFIKVAHGENLYELSWDAPETKSIITNYTLFMCTSNEPYVCKANMQWIIFPSNIFRFNQTINDSNYQFAISANTNEGSSGMFWAECTISSDKTQGKLSSVWIADVGHNYMKVIWKLSCADHIGIIEGFQISYCQIVKAQSECIGETHTQTINGTKSIDTGTISGLKPYTTYKLAVRVQINNTTYSQWSDEMYNTTGEAAPSSPPLNITVYNKTNSSISLRWDPPLNLNGKLKLYEIYVNDLNEPIDPDRNNYTLKNLRSFTTYNISMKACTVHCSNLSDNLILTTDMYNPGQINKPVIGYVNSSIFTFIWDKPKEPGGKINYYQLQFTPKLDALNDTYDMMVNITNDDNLNKLNYSINCDSKAMIESYVSVRAVNIINGTHRHGLWSPPLAIYCSQPSSLAYIILGISLIFVGVALFVGGKRTYIWVKEIKNIDPKLPPGLQGVVELEKHPEDSDRHSGADQVLLLDKFSANESGISSGHESITSSVESGGALISGSEQNDSGNEQPMSLEDRKNSLRQRNVSNKGYVMSDAIPTTINWGAKASPTSGNYCMLGVAPSAQPESEPSYVPITDMSTNSYKSDLPAQPPPYVVTGDFVKTPNPGYIPYNAPEPVSKNTGYVVAGVPKDLLASDLLHCESPKPLMEEKKKVVDNLSNLKGIQFPWQQTTDPTTLKTGYVSVGDAPPPKSVVDVSKAYVPHRQFEAKALKED